MQHVWLFKLLRLNRMYCICEPSMCLHTKKQYTGTLAENTVYSMFEWEL